MMSDEQAEVRSTRLSPITFCQQGKLNEIPVPLVRLSLCGLIEVEVLTEVVSRDPGLGRYEVLSPQTLRGRGAVPALMLLKLLASCPQRFATCDWLAEQMGQEMDTGALVRLDSIASALRGVLCRLKVEEGPAVDVLRLLLVTYLRNGRSSGPGYQLASHPLLWIDSDALGDHVGHGALMERMGEPMLALPFWQRAFDLGSRGDYLPDEPHSEWAVAKREQVAGHLRQSVHALHRLLLAEQGASAKEEVILLLRTYWQTHKTDEDALRPLMELLGTQERFGEAEDYYQQCCLALSEVEKGQHPDPRTYDLHEFLRIKQIRRGPFTTHVFERDQSSHSALGESVHTQESVLLESSETVDRREVTKYIGTLGLGLTGFFTLPPNFLEILYSVPSKPSRADGEMLSDFAVLTHLCLRLSEGSQLATAERILWSFLPEVESLAQQPYEHQQRAASLASQGYLIAASLVGHRNDLLARQRFSEQAWLYGGLAQDCNLQVAALRQLAVTFDYLERPNKVLKTYQRALPYLDDVAPRLRGCIYAALSGVYAQMKQKQEAYRFMGLAYEHFPDEIDEEPHFLRLINANYHTLILWDGLNQLELHQPHLAEKTLAQLDILAPKAQMPERIRVELLAHRSKVCTAVGQLELACMYLEAAVKASLEIGSRRRLEESFTFFQKIRERWPHERQVQQLGDLFAHPLINHV